MLDQLKAPAAVWRHKDVGFWSLLHRWSSDFVRLRERPSKAQSALLARLFVEIANAACKMDQHWPSGRAVTGSVGLCINSRSVRSKSFSFLGLQHVLLRLDTCTKFVCSKVVEQLQFHLHEAQLASLQEERDRATQWAEDAFQGSARQAHAFLKQGEGRVPRPFAQDAPEKRPALPRQYWVKLWGHQEARHSLSPVRQELLRKAIEEAGQQKAISSAQIRHTLQACGRKKEGPHGLTFDLMRQLPEEGLSALTFLYHRIEATGLWPSSLHHVMIALLRKNEESERPIGLLSALYRLWALGENAG